jgi:hypothetical protein
MACLKIACQLPFCSNIPLQCYGERAARWYPFVYCAAKVLPSGLTALEHHVLDVLLG